MGQTRQYDTRTELSRPGEPGLTTRMVEKGIQQQQPVTLRAHTGHGYLVVGPGFGCTSPESRMRSHDREKSEGRCGFDE